MFTIHEKKIAILVFAQSAKEEVRHKSIPQGIELFSELNAKTLSEVEKTNLPYFHFSENLQRGNSFGERFVNAVELVFANGFEKIIAIGNDSPRLNSKHLIDAAHALDQGKSALGPSKDGGFYLLGLDNKHFEKEIFRQFSWQKQTLLKEIRVYLENLGAPLEKLGYLSDIDSFRDLKLILQTEFKSLSIKLRMLISRIFNQFQIDSENFCNLFRANKCGLCDLVRGSP